jgi:LysM repeat protein
MKRLLIFSIFCLSCSQLFAQKAEVKGEGVSPAEYAAGNDARINYIKQYYKAAQRDMEAFGIPASIKLAQAILESNSGQSTLAREANNHFGIKCHKNWDGKTYEKEDDDRDASGQLIKSCFRKYKQAEDSFNDHSLFLTDKKKAQRYGFLFDLDRRDYKSWAYGLQSAGYATSTTYAEMLIRIIEEYELSAYDYGKDVAQTTPDGRELPGSDFEQPRRGGGGRAPRASAIGRNNDVRAISAHSGQTLQELARRYGLNPAKVACFNDCQIAVTQVLAENEVIYLGKKRKKWRGRTKEVRVEKNETMFSIAQKYGIQLMSLYTLNNMEGGTEPIQGETIKLKGRKRKDSVKVRTDIGIKPPVVTQPRPAGTPTVPSDKPPVKTDPSPYKPTDSEMFEMSEGGVSQPTKPTNTPTTTTGRPATTGSSRPDTPTPTPTETRPSAPGTSWPSNGTTTTTPTPSAPKPPASTPSGYHTIVKGDTLYSLSRTYGISVDKLRELNGLANNDIKIGQMVRVK